MSRGCVRRSFLAVLVLALALLAVGLPPPATAQGLPPHLYYGSVGGVMVDGEPWDGTTPLVVIDRNGAAIASAGVNAGIWSASIPAGSRFRFQVGAAVSTESTAVSGSLTELTSLALTTPETPPEPEEPETTTLSYGEGASVSLWLGPTMPAADVAALFPAGVLIAIFGFDNATGTYLSYRPAVPAALNTLDTVVHRQPYTFLLGEPAEIETEIVALDLESVEPITVTLSPGFNQVPWLEADTSAADVAARVLPAGAVSALFLFDNDTATYLTYRPGLPATLNTLAIVHHNDVVTISIAATAAEPITITQTPLLDASAP